jgi:thiamine transport system permease protein
MLLGGPRFATIEVEIYIQTMHMLNFPLASLLSVLQLLFTFFITTLSIKLGRASMAPFMPRLRGERVKRLSSCGSKVFAMSMIFLLVIILMLPVVALGLRSVIQLEAVRGGRGSFTSGLTLDFYREIFINRRQSLFFVPPITAVRNSMIYALSASVLSVFLGMLAALALTRTQRKSIWLDSLLMLPLGTSAVTMGFGFVIAFSQLSDALHYYPLLIPIVHTLVSLPFVVRVLQPALAAIPQSLRQAAQALGASPFQVWRNIDLPIIGRAVAVSAIFSFTISLGEFGATSFLTRPDIPTIPIAIFRYLNLPGAMNYGQAMAMATILLIVCGLSMWLMESLLINVSE